MSRSRSYCPIHLTLELVGDRWTLLILRDMMFAGKRHFRELLQSDEGISTNILASRLARLVDHGLITRNEDPTHRQKVDYRLTEKGIAFLPVIVQMGAWGSQWVPDAAKQAEGEREAVRALQEGGPVLWAAIMDELREVHSGLADVAAGRVTGNEDARQKLLNRFG